MFRTLLLLAFAVWCAASGSDQALGRRRIAGAAAALRDDAALRISDVWQREVCERVSWRIWILWSRIVGFLGCEWRILTEIALEPLFIACAFRAATY